MIQFWDEEFANIKISAKSNSNSWKRANNNEKKMIRLRVMPKFQNLNKLNDTQKSLSRNNKEIYKASSLPPIINKNVIIFNVRNSSKIVNIFKLYLHRHLIQISLEEI